MLDFRPLSAVITASVRYRSIRRDLSLIDLHGRRIAAADITRKRYLSGVTVAMKITLPPGLYLVDFSGSGGVARTKVSVLQ